ncbi:MAG: glycosyltransferase family 2 protein [Myxococcales bacterium]|nr:glycosyltransferase family 2 protein [Myxococcales bacterium]
MSQPVLNRCDENRIPESSKCELRLFMVVRNEELRLPHLLASYFERGVDRLFAVDNGSTDDTREMLLADSRHHVFEAGDGFEASQSGRLWLLSLMARYGQGHWCLIADADEMLIYPGYERLSLCEFTRFLDEVGANGLYCHLLDMYSDRPIRETNYERGADPLRSCAYFDADYQKVVGTFHDRIEGVEYPIDTHAGGMRSRVFGVEPYCSKVPLLRYDSSLVLARGWHDMIGLQSCGIQGAVLHFKYLWDFPSRVELDAKRSERRNVADEYAAYLAALTREPGLCLHHPDSIRFKNSDGLIDVGVMKSTPAFDRFLAENP